MFLYLNVAIVSGEITRMLKKLLTLNYSSCVNSILCGFIKFLLSSAIAFIKMTNFM